MRGIKKHSTFNAQYPMKPRARGIGRSMLNVERSQSLAHGKKGLVFHFFGALTNRCLR
jgi:hypothetical protein